MVGHTILDLSLVDEALFDLSFKFVKLLLLPSSLAGFSTGLSLQFFLDDALLS